MKNINDIFAQRAINPSSLNTYGFKQDDHGYLYSSDLLKGQFIMSTRITMYGKVSTTLMDKSTGEDYILHLIPSATGSFVGKIRDEYERKLTDIAEKCFVLKIFKSKQAIAVIQFIKDKYQNDLEFLWPRFPKNAIFRRKDNAKWYGAILTVENKKLGISDDNVVEILDLKMETADIAVLVDNKKYFPGYHMNKKHWVTIRLDESVPLEEIFMRIDNSFMLAIK